MDSALNVVRDVNLQLRDFVQRPENQRLIPATGYFSTPFRGNLFGHPEASAVAQQLSAGRTVEVLWLGTNPRVPESLSYIQHPPSGQGYFPTFTRQMNSETLSEKGDFRKSLGCGHNDTLAT
jgi:hypothetical protein